MVDDEARVGVAIDQRRAGIEVPPAQDVDRKVVASGRAQETGCPLPPRSAPRSRRERRARELGINNAFDHNIRIHRGRSGRPRCRPATNTEGSHARIALDRRNAFSLAVPSRSRPVRAHERDWWTSLRRSTLMPHQLTFVKSPLMNVRILHAAERNDNTGGMIVSALKKSYSSGLRAVLWKWRVSKLRKSLRDTFWIRILFASDAEPFELGTGRSPRPISGI
jgi:hypothetical protein